MNILKNTQDQLREERRKNEALQAQLAQARADVDYIAIMSDIDIDTGEESGE